MSAPGERCPACGNLRPAGTGVSGLCPLCLLQIGLEHEQEGQAGWIDPETWECRVLNLLGAEGGETSFLAEQGAPVKRLVVLRQVHVPIASPDDRALVTARLRALTSFDHPHVARVIGGLISNERGLLLVMAYAPGTPLETYCGRTHPAEQDRLSLLLAVAEAIGRAHDRGLVHGALTSSRVVVTRRAGVAHAVVTGLGVEMMRQRPPDPSADARALVELCGTAGVKMPSGRLRSAREIADWLRAYPLPSRRSTPTDIAGT